MHTPVCIYVCMSYPITFRIVWHEPEYKQRICTVARLFRLIIERLALAAATCSHTPHPHVATASRRLTPTRTRLASISHASCCNVFVHSLAHKIFILQWCFISHLWNCIFIVDQVSLHRIKLGGAVPRCCCRCSFVRSLARWVKWKFLLCCVEMHTMQCVL